MLKKVMRHDLEEGMRFSAPVFFDDGENMLASKGVPIKKRELDALDRWKISYVLTAGEVLPDSADSSGEMIDQPTELDELEELEDLDEEDEMRSGGAVVQSAPVAARRTENPAPAAAQKTPVSMQKAPVAVQKPASSVEKPELDRLEYTSEQILKLPSVLANDALYSRYTALISSLDAVFEDLRSKSEIRTRSIDKIVSDLFNLVVSDRSEILGFILGGDVEESRMAKSSVNIAILSIIIGEHLGLPRHRLLQIATAALLHDVGMIKVPENIVSKEGKLDEAETQAMRSHTFYGYKMIVNELLYADEVGRAAVQHHERWDGEGYPGRIAGAAIDIGARIISVADAFEAMVSPKTWRDAMVGYQAMKNLLADNARRFDPDIIKAMIQSIGIYPIGSIVLMNNSVIARVIDSHKEAPLRPKIRVLIDEFAKPYTQNEGEIVNLMENRNLFIARAIDPAEYRKFQ
ncbi:MAG: HD-GYP domain-containing protein [Spirochaetales bacterium]|nr:HD-GYP domain-containing protein [Spirochaetales bacterium]